MKVKMKPITRLSIMVYGYRPKRISRAEESMDLFIINGRAFFIRKR